MTRTNWLILQSALVMLTASVALSDQQFITSGDLPSYKPSSIKKSELNSIGSDSMDGLIALWTNRYSALQPDANVKNYGRGSAAAPAALIDGSADLGPMARPMKSLEESAFLKQFGFEPTSITTSFAAIAVYVSKDNPLDEISLEELDAIFSRSDKRAGNPVSKWSDLGVDGAIAKEKIVKVGRDTNLPLSSYFRQQVLLQGEFSEQLMQTVSRESLFETIAANSSAIGFAEAVKESDKVKVLAIKASKDSPAVLPSYENIADGSYPLARALSVYLVRDPEEPVDAALSDFLGFVLSAQGQRVVESQGLVPVTAEIRERELAKLK